MFIFFFFYFALLFVRQIYINECARATIIIMWYVCACLCTRILCLRIVDKYVVHTMYGLSLLAYITIVFLRTNYKRINVFWDSGVKRCYAKVYACTLYVVCTCELNHSIVYMHARKYVAKQQYFAYTSNLYHTIDRGISEVLLFSYHIISVCITIKIFFNI